MNIAVVMDELGEALDTIDGLRPAPYFQDSISPPAGIVGWPETSYDSTAARGSDKLAVPVFVIVGKADARSSRNLLAIYLAGSGAKSIKAAIDSYDYTACDVARTASSRVETMTIAGTTYLGAVFDVEIIGRGT